MSRGRADGQRRVVRVAALVLMLALGARAAHAEPSQNASAPRTDLIEAHKQTYALPWTADQRVTDEDERRRVEVSFQFSFRKQLLDFKWFPLELGYTQKSFWQLYDKDRSAPFRETNYNPEFFLDFTRTVLADAPWGLHAGIEHESNGESPERSRSWNRTYLRLIYWPGDASPTFVALKVWDRWNERLKASPDDVKGDDNPEIEHYVGNWELQAYVLLTERLEASLLLRKRVRPYSPSALGALDYRVGNGLYVRAQVYSGYGESLIDYDRRVARYGIGFALRPELAGARRHDVRGRLL